MTRTILVPTDGFGPAGKAVDLAADLASKHGARIHLLHVLLHDKDAADVQALPALSGLDAVARERLAKLAAAPPDPGLSAAALAMDPEAVAHPLPEEMLQPLGQAILESAEHAAKAKGVAEVTHSVTEGEPVACILAAAESEGADMIVMGHRGLDGIEGLTYGSVSDKVSHLASCTVVMIK